MANLALETKLILNACKESTMNLQELVSILENLTDDCQRILLDALKEIIYRQKGPAKLKPCAELDCVVEIGLLVYEKERYDVPKLAKKSIRKLYTYLVRKYDSVPYFDPETCKVVEIPKGSMFVSVLDVSKKELVLRLKFPDDEVTELLDLFGANRCWNL
jgi:hypothetical protein